jgi:hypothetical protein
VKTTAFPIAHRMISRTRCVGSVFVVGVLFSHAAAFSAEGEPLPASGKAIDPAPREAAKNRQQLQMPSGQAALTVGVPFFLDKFLVGELTVDVRYGHKFWWLVPYISGGFRQTRLDPIGWPWATRTKKLLAWHVTVGTRLEFPASQKLFPFVGIAVEQSYWAYTEDSTAYCHESYYPSAWRCYQARDWQVGHALKPQIGLLYKPEASLALEFWVEYVHVVAPGMFTRSIGIVQPALGLAWHH